MMNTMRATIVFFLIFVTLAVANAQLSKCSDQGSWSKESFVPGATVEISSPLLLTDGRVMAQYVSGGKGSGWQDWWALTPGKTGCYSLNAAKCAGGPVATWAQLASLSTLAPTYYAPAAFASAVLPDGKVILEGGEDNGGTGSVNRVETNLGAIYDPATNTWKQVPAPSGWANIGDAPSVVLADGKFMLGNACGNDNGIGQTALFDEAGRSWKSMPQPPEWTAEASFTLLPDKSVLMVGTCYSGQLNTNTCTTVPPNSSEIYNPKTNAWSSAGSTPQQLYGSVANSCFSGGPTFGEQGPAALLPTGNYFATGGFVVADNAVHTSVYETPTGIWASSPDLPSVTIGGAKYPLSAEDNSAVVLTDGNLLISTVARNGMSVEGGPYYIEWQHGDYCQVKNVPRGMCGQSEMLTLPTGQILITCVSWGGPVNYFIYTPAGTTYPGIQPEISSVPATVIRGHTYKITGVRFNGATQSSFLGDDFQNATNYPLVRITPVGTTDVFYFKTHNPSTMAVATTGTVSTEFDVPLTAPTGLSELVVVTNGIPSNPMYVTVNP
jgi:hypothetical protein